MPQPIALVLTYAAALVVGYLCGSIPFGLIRTRPARTPHIPPLAGLTGSAAPPAVLWFTADQSTALLFVPLTALLWLMHRANIGRLLAGAEPKIGRRDREAA